MKSIRYPWNIAVGAMDAITGLLLVISPAWVMSLLKIPGQVPPEYLGWIGVFVGAVGLSYMLAMKGGVVAETVWRFTALVRSMVGIFLLVKIFTGMMPGQWLTVAATDLLVAAVQIAGLRAGWWKETAG